MVQLVKLSKIIHQSDRSGGGHGSHGPPLGYLPVWESETTSVCLDGGRSWRAIGDVCARRPSSPDDLSLYQAGARLYQSVGRAVLAITPSPTTDGWLQTGSRLGR